VLTIAILCFPLNNRCDIVRVQAQRIFNTTEGHVTPPIGHLDVNEGREGPLWVSTGYCCSWPTDGHHLYG
jgi:hypothetical protein